MKRNYDTAVIYNLSNGSSDYLYPWAKFYQKYFKDLELIREHFKDKIIVYYLAVVPTIQPSFILLIYNEKVNFIGTINCLSASYFECKIKYIYEKLNEAMLAKSLITWGY